MKKFIVIIFIFVILVTMSNRIAEEFVPAEVLSKIENNRPEAVESGMDGINYDELEWKYEDSLGEDDENYFPETSYLDSGFYKHELMDFDTSSDAIEISEDFFVSHMADVYLNAPNYLGKTISYEGMFFSVLDEDSNKLYKYVLRYGPGCCAIDGVVGLEIFTDEKFQEKDWVKITGTLSEYQGPQYKHLVLENVKLELMDKSGAETVYR